MSTLASELGVKVTVGGVGDTVYPPIPPSPAPSEEPEPQLSIATANSYTPLKGDEIRLLILNPGSSDEPIGWFLETCSVAEAKCLAALMSGGLTRRGGGVASSWMAIRRA